MDAFSEHSGVCWKKSNILDKFDKHCQIVKIQKTQVETIVKSEIEIGVSGQRGSIHLAEALWMLFGK